MSKYRVGTNNFPSVKAAEQFYAPYGYDEQDVQHKISVGEIMIGKPVLDDGLSLVLIDGGLRYAIQED